MLVSSMLHLIGKTPMVRLQLSDELGVELLAKLENFNPCSSVKDRIAHFMIEEAIKDGLITAKSTIIEATSGNTGIGLAFVCAVKKIPLILTMPESMSVERRKILIALGANLILTPANKGMAGAVKEAEECAKKLENSFIPSQFSNMNNPKTHELTTAPEIWEDCAGRIDAFVAGVGTGGTITGVGSFLKNKNDEIKVIAVEPKDSDVLSGGTAGSHKIQGIGAGFVPKTLNPDIYDEIITVSNDDALETTRYLIQNEGILCGISSGAIAHAAIQLAKRQEYKGKQIVFMICDTAERYLSTDLFNEQ